MYCRRTLASGASRGTCSSPHSFSFFVVSTKQLGREFSHGNFFVRNVFLAIAPRLRPRGSLIFLWSRVENIKRNESHLSLSGWLDGGQPWFTERENDRGRTKPSSVERASIETDVHGATFLVT